MGRLSVKKQRFKRQQQKTRKKHTQQPMNNCKKANCSSLKCTDSPECEDSNSVNMTDCSSLGSPDWPPPTSADSPVYRCEEYNPDSNSSLGSPDWPPPSPDSPLSNGQEHNSNNEFKSPTLPEREISLNKNNKIIESNPSPSNCDESSKIHTLAEPLSKEEINLYGIDGTIFCYNEDEKGGFQLADGRYLEGDELIDFLVMNNRKLAAKARFYHTKYCKANAEISTRSVAAKQKMERIRQFYQDILYGNSRSGLMVQKAIARNVQ